MNTAKELKDNEVIDVDFSNRTNTLRSARDAILQLRKEKEILTAEVEKLKHYQDLAYEDALSGLMNRRAFDKDLSLEIARASRKTDYTFSVLLIDLNDFKNINDTHGHKKGDETIQWIAQFLKSQVRLQDTVYRIGGDEFAVILPDTPSRGARVVMSRMMEVLSLSNTARPFSVRMSVGASTYKTDSLELHGLLDIADKRMYQSKNLQKKAAMRRRDTFAS
jgi:diguanylate cyclase (GGDEF)-like protein